MLKLLSSILFLISSTAFCAGKYTCIDGKTRQIVQGAKVYHSEEYCFSADKTEIISKSCLAKNCAAYTGTKRYFASELLSPIGTPGFRVCRDMGGEPEILAFRVMKKYYDTDRCVFSDGSFVSTDELVELYLDRNEEPAN